MIAECDVSPRLISISHRMNIIGVMARKAVSAVSCLAERADDGVLMSAQEIARIRGISPHLMGKILSALSTVGIVEGTRGPGGGFKLGRPASQVTFYDVVAVFDSFAEPLRCPMGKNWCGSGPKCPMHDALVALEEAAIRRMKEMHFGDFVGRAVSESDLSPEWL